MKISRRVFAWCTGAALVAAALPGTAVAAGTKSIAYYGVNNGSYLVDWQPKKRARVVNYDGAGVGSVFNDGTQNIVTMDAPISTFIDGFMDDCGNVIQQRKDLAKVAVRDVDGSTSQINEVGTYTNIGGCQDGLVTPFGSVDDAGTSLKRLSMAARPPVTDLVPGTQLAGFSEDLTTPDSPYPTVDVTTLQAGGTVLFQTTGHVVPAAFDANQWLVFSLPTQQRGYTRLVQDAKTGGETWLIADWVGGQPQTVRGTFVVKPLAGAGFGSVTAASRMWESGLFVGTNNPFFIYLYKNGTGERVQKDLALGTELRRPINSWGFDGLNLVQTRILGGGPLHADRSWIPLRNEGKVRWVMESEVWVDGTDVTLMIKPRINYYLDTGKAVPPVVTERQTGMVYLGQKPKLAR